MLSAGYMRHYDSTLRLLASRGHKIHLAYQSDRNKDGVEQVRGERFAAEFSSVSIGAAPARVDLWSDLARVVRRLQDYVRYFAPEYRDAFALRERVEREVPAGIRVAVRALLSLGSPARRLISRSLRLVESAIPSSGAIEEFLRQQRPDLLLVTPLVDPGSDQVDYIKAAKRLSIPSGFCVASWDNLTNKGVARVTPDRVFVWNESQKDEAVRLHGAPASAVVVTGAQLFDPWFGREPSATRAEFCRRVGIADDKPFILYVGSSRFIAPNEAAFVEKWVRWVRSAPDPQLAGAGLMIRPHPNNAHQYLGIDLSVFQNVSVWPPFGSKQLETQYENDYFDSLYYSAATVGVNTSAMIEAGIMGHSVATVLAPEFAHSQAGTLHFDHLANAATGLLHVAVTPEEHVAQLAEALHFAGRPDPRSVRFVQTFVRPHGLSRPATPILVDALEALGATSPTPARVPVQVLIVRALLLPAMLTARLLWPAERRPWWVYPLRVGLDTLVRTLQAWAVARCAARDSSVFVSRYCHRLEKQSARSMTRAMRRAAKTGRHLVRSAAKRAWKVSRRVVRRADRGARKARRRIQNRVVSTILRVRRRQSRNADKQPATANASARTEYRDRGQ